MIKLNDVGFRDIVENGYYETYTEKVGTELHRYRLNGRNNVFIYLKCSECGHVRQVINPDYLGWFINSKQKKKEKKINKPQVKFDSIDKKHFTEGMIKYDGDIKKDFLQPYLPDGSLNQEFVDTYGMP